MIIQRRQSSTGSLSLLISWTIRCSVRSEDPHKKRGNLPERRTQIKCCFDRGIEGGKRESERKKKSESTNVEQTDRLFTRLFDHWFNWVDERFLLVPSIFLSARSSMMSDDQSSSRQSSHPLLLLRMFTRKRAQRFSLLAPDMFKRNLLNNQHSLSHH